MQRTNSIALAIVIVTMSARAQTPGAATAPAPAPAASVPAMLNQGTEYMSKHNFSGANTSFDEALTHASAAHEPALEAGALFKLGVLAQKKADASTNEDERDRLYEEAVGYYNRTLAFGIQPGAALNRIAYVRMKQGRDLESVQALYQALALNDEFRSYYAEMIGDYYAHIHDVSAALACYHEALQGPGTSSIRRKILSILIPSADDRFPVTSDTISFLSEAYRAQDADAAMSGALDTLQYGTPDEKQVHALFALLAASLGTKSYDNVALAQSGVMAKLVAIGSARNDCAAPTDTIRRLYSGEFPPLEWWSDSDQQGLAVSPASGMRALLRTLGNAAFSRRDYASAEKLFAAAVNLTPDPDLRAATLLFSVYVATQREPEIESLEAAVNQRVRNSPAVDWNAAYEYERSIGSRDLSRGDWTAAAAHLSAATEALQRANVDNKRRGLPQIAPDPWIYKNLGDAYKATEKKSEAVRAFVQSGEGYVDFGDAVAGRSLLAPIAFTDVPDDFVNRYSSIIGTGVSVPNAAITPDPLRGLLAIVATAKTPAERERAMQFLRGEYGIQTVRLSANGVQGEASLPTGDVLPFVVSAANASMSQP